VLVITADVHERASGVPQMLEALGARVEVRALTRGDYVAGPETVVERKTVADLHISIAAGRFWHQMRRIRTAGRWPYLLIEGSSVFRGGVPPNGIRGLCLAVSDLVMRHFGSLRQVAAASRDDLQTLPGVGSKRAAAIVALIHDQPHAPDVL